MNIFQGKLRLAALASLVLVGFTACDNDGVAGPETGPMLNPVEIEVASGNDQTGVVGTPLSSPLRALVTDTEGEPVAGAEVGFAIVQGGGTFAASGEAGLITRAGADGVAEATWILGAGAGTEHEVVARLLGDDGAGGVVVEDEIYFTATAIAGDAVEYEGIGSDVTPDLPPGGVLEDVLDVVVYDSFGNPVEGVTVSWEAEGGDVIPAQAVTGADGHARSSFVAGRDVGTVRVIGDVGGIGEIVYTFNIVPSSELPADSIAIVGDKVFEVGPGEVVGILSVKVMDSRGFPVKSAQVQWAFEEGEGEFQSTVTSTNADGISDNRAQVGGSAELHLIAAWLPSSPEDSVEFEIHVRSGAPESLTKISGDGQSGLVTDTLESPYVVEVRDSNGNPVSGAVISWNAVAGSLIEAEAVTNSLGRASALHVLGEEAGEQSVEVSATGIEGSGVTFTSTAEPRAPSAMTIVSGDNQVGLPGSTLPNPLIAEVTDAYGNEIEGVEVSWDVITGSGSIASSQAETGADGRVQATYKLGNESGTETIKASIEWSTSASVTFSVRAAEVSLLKVSGDNQSADRGEQLDEPLVVRVVDSSNGDGIENAAVSWEASNGGSVSATTTFTDAQGYAQVTRTLGATAGSYTTTASIGEQQVSFTSTALVPAGAPRIEKVSGDNQQGVAGEPLANPYVVRLVNSAGSPIAGADVKWRVESGGGTISESEGTTNEQGRDSITVTLPDAPEGTTQVVRAWVAEDSAQFVEFTSSVASRSDAAELRALEGEGSIVLANPAAPSDQQDKEKVSVLVLDQNGEPVEGYTVFWSIVSGAGSLSEVGAGGQDATDENGIASAYVQASREGEIVVRAEAEGLDGSPVNFTLTAVAPAYVDIQRGNMQRAIEGDTLPQELVAVVKDSASRVLKGVPVYWRVTQGDGSLGSFKPVITDDNGEADMTYRVGSKDVHEQHVEAYIPGVSDVATFTAFATGEPFAIIKVSGDNQSESEPTSTAESPLVVQVVDENGHAVGLAEVVWQDRADEPTIQARKETDGQTTYEWAATFTTRTDEDGYAYVRARVFEGSDTNILVALSNYPLVDEETFTITYSGP